ncbi:MAG: hypothetical protein INF52_01695 [Rhodobacter sp.]|nr:hypothetical protein [Rhodobacter sp.]
MELLRRGFDLTLVRAFDPVPDIAPAIELAADLGFRRILTSGQAATAAEGRAGLERCFALAGGAHCNHAGFADFGG